MTTSDWLAAIASVTAIIGSLFFGLRWLVKSIMNEIGPTANGYSLNGRVTRIEARLNEIYAHILER